MIYFKTIILLLSLLFSGMLLDEIIENTILFIKGKGKENDAGYVMIVPIGIFMMTIVSWCLFYFLIHM